MNSRLITASVIPKAINYVEKIVITLTIIGISALLYIYRDIPRVTSLLPNWFIVFPLLICACLSFVFPINRPLWQRRLYIFLEMGAIISTQLTDWSFELLAYVVIAKSCILLPRKEAIFTTIITGILFYSFNIYHELYRLPERIEIARSQLEKIEQIYTPQLIIFSNIANSSSYIAASLFVIILCYVLISEQKIRQKSEYLTQEVEDLAIQLERSRIARDIHDSLGHTLTTLDIQLELAQKLRSRSTEQALQTLDNAKILSSQALQEVRRSVQMMRSSQFNLNDALRELAQWVQQNQSFQLRLDINLPKLPLQTSHQLYCLAQEALTNIQKHTQANYVTLRGYTIDASQSVYLEVIDDGQGFNPSIPTMGFGLWGMRERIKILKGELIIHSIPNSGTHIQITIPLD